MMTEWENNSVKATEGEAPADGNYHRLDPENPYKAKYGDIPENMIRILSPFNKGFVCFKDLIHHIFLGTHRMYFFTTHE